MGRREVSNRRISPDVIGLVGLALTLVAVAIVQLFGGWGYLLAIPALVLMLSGLFGMQREMSK